MHNKEKIKELRAEIQQNMYLGTESIEKTCDELIALAQSVNDEESLTMGQLYKASNDLSTGKLEESFENISKCLKYVQKHNHAFIKIRAYNLLALCYKNVNDDNLALDSFYKALSASQEAKDNEYEAKIKNNIGDMFLALREYNVALQYFLETYKIADSIEDASLKIRVKMITLINLCEVDIHLGKYEQALKCINEAEEQVRAHGITTLLSAVYGLQAIANYYDSKLDIAVSKIDILIKEHSNNTDDLINSFDVYANVLDIALIMKDQKRCDILLGFLDGYVSLINSTHFTLRTLEYHIKHHEVFNDMVENGESSLIYREYYRYSVINNENRFKNRSNSLLVKLDFLETLQKQHAIAKQNEELRRLSNYDELTCIPNRRFFKHRLHQLFDSLEKDQYIGIIVFDVDFFKEYNDNYGHLQGDEVLRQIAKCLKPQSSHFFETRYGGDEFVVICHDVGHAGVEEYIESVLERLRKMNITHDYSPKTSQITMTYGYSLNCVEEVDAHQLIKKADKTLFENKSKARKR